MSELPCYKCSALVPAKRATYTRDGRIACPNCTKKLGMRIVPRSGFEEVTRMMTREAIEAMRDIATKKLNDARQSNPQGEVERYETIHLTLEWVLGESKDEPIERKA